MSIGGRFPPVRALILGNLRKSGKARVFGGRLDDDPVTKVKLFLWQILHGNTARAAISRLLVVLFSVAGYCKRRMRLSVTLFDEEEYLPRITRIMKIDRETAILGSKEEE